MRRASALLALGLAASAGAGSVTTIRDTSVFDNSAQTIFYHPLTAGNTAQHRIKGQFNTFLTDIINIGQAQEVGTYFTRWIITPIFALESNAGQTQLIDLLHQIRCDMPFQVDKLTPLLAT